LEFRKTEKQIEAVKTLSLNKYTALYGGSRSGKTFIIVRSLIVRASKTKSRHLIMRQTFNAVKRSIFMDTLPKVLSLCFPDLSYTVNKTDLILYLPNGSEIHLAGMDNGKAVEKILGTEFSTIYFNEASEMEYSPIQLVLSRLAEKSELQKRVWFDFNPPQKTHWSYWLFVKKLNPVDEEPLTNPEQYDYLLMNPADNLANIDPEYLKLLESMPEAERNRFLLGQYSDASDGQVYYAFDRDEHVQETHKGRGQIYIGMDFNVDPMTATIWQVVNNEYHCIDEIFLWMS
jgi:PBSX family phage terminase large subunit